MVPPPNDYHASRPAKPGAQGGDVAHLFAVTRDDGPLLRIVAPPNDCREHTPSVFVELGGVVMGLESPCLVSVRGAVVAVVGELDVAGVPALTDALSALADSWQLDLSAVTFIDSCGLLAILRLCDSDLTELISVSPIVRRLFVVAGLGGLVVDK